MSGIFLWREEPMETLWPPGQTGNLGVPLCPLGCFRKL